jgi:hypothetical protein
MGETLAIAAERPMEKIYHGGIEHTETRRMARS